MQAVQPAGGPHRRGSAVAGGAPRGRRHPHLPARALAGPARSVRARTAPAASCSRAASAAATSGPGRASRCGSPGRAAARAVDDAENLHVLFAGGIHDARSAAMVAAIGRAAGRRGAPGSAC